jgi:hypothetical protein
VQVCPKKFGDEVARLALVVSLSLTECRSSYTSSSGEMKMSLMLIN